MTISASAKKAARQALEEAFFRDVDEMIVRRLRSEAESEDAHKLLQSTGLHDPTLIEELTKLGVTAEGLVAMRLVPLVMIAWARDGVDPKERSVVMAEAYRFGVVEGSVAGVLLEHWLTHKPPLAIYDAWRRYMESELATMSLVAKAKLIALMESQMQAVANASGGVLGVARASLEEQALIDIMTRVLRE
jgi:hypothetical protein